MYHGIDGGSKFSIFGWALFLKYEEVIMKSFLKVSLKYNLMKMGNKPLDFVIK